MPFNAFVGQKPINKIHCKVKRIWNQLVVFRNLEKVSRSEECYSKCLEKYSQFVLENFEENYEHSGMFSILFNKKHDKVYIYIYIYKFKGN